MYYAFLLLFAILVAAGGVLVYRTLIHSRGFSRLIGGVVEPAPESDDEIVDSYHESQNRLQHLATQNDGQARTSKATAKRVRKELGSKSRR